MSGFSAGGQLCDAHSTITRIWELLAAIQALQPHPGSIDLVGHNRAMQQASVTNRNGDNDFGDRRQNHVSTVRRRPVWERRSWAFQRRAPNSVRRPGGLDSAACADGVDLSTEIAITPRCNAWWAADVLILISLFKVNSGDKADGGGDGRTSSNSHRNKTAGCNRFHAGDVVVYPHGVGRVEREAFEEIAGRRLNLIRILSTDNQMTLRVPARPGAGCWIAQCQPADERGSSRRIDRVPPGKPADLGQARSGMAKTRWPKWCTIRSWPTKAPAAGPRIVVAKTVRRPYLS